MGEGEGERGKKKQIKNIPEKNASRGGGKENAQSPTKIIPKRDQTNNTEEVVDVVSKEMGEKKKGRKKPMKRYLS